jgi:RNA polymerase sigma factor (sigma-70 family)
MKGINSYLDKGQNSGVKITTWIFNHLDWGYSELIKIQKKQESIRHFDPEDKMIKKEFEEKTIFNEDTIDLISIKEQFSEVKKCLELLTKKQQEVIYCHFYHGMTFDQIGKKYQCTRAATNYHYNNGIKKIRELMGVK